MVFITTGPSAGLSRRKIRITTLMAKVMAADNRRYKVVTAEKNGETVNCACFEIDEKLGDYVRFTVIDEKGREAKQVVGMRSSTSSPRKLPVR